MSISYVGGNSLLREVREWLDWFELATVTQRTASYNRSEVTNISEWTIC